MSKPDWITTIFCPYCHAAVLNEFNREDMPDDLEDDEDELEKIDSQFDITVINGCGHVAYECVCGFLDPVIHPKWDKELRILARHLNPEEYSGGAEDDIGETAEDSNEMEIDEVAALLETTLEDLDITDKKLKKIASSILPGYHITFVDESFDSHAEGPPGGYTTMYQMIFLNKEKDEKKKKTTRSNKRNG